MLELLSAPKFLQVPLILHGARNGSRRGAARDPYLYEIMNSRRIYDGQEMSHE